MARRQVKLIKSTTNELHLLKDGQSHSKGCKCHIDRWEAGRAFWDLIAKAQKNGNVHEKE